ncbi:MAG: hypothetical protein PUD63_12330 [Clostridia bacterium]|nr:hypothetical protein [Clostridia bacterium]
MKAFKGFTREMKCRDFQFEEGKTYEEPVASLCNSGFHACEHPLNCFAYYPPSKSVYHEVELDGVSDERGDDTKVVAQKITVGSRLTIADMVKAAVDFTFAKAKWEKGDKATGYWSAASSTGAHGAASATGDQGVAAAFGIDGKAKGAANCWIVCAEWKRMNDAWQRVDVRCARVDGKTIRADTWYRLMDGEFVEVEDDE